MSNARERTFAKTLNTWVQTIAIIVAAVWGGYTFVYKEIILPKAAPINVTVNLQLKKASNGDLKYPLVAIEMHVSATNPSSRKVYLLPNAFFVSGIKLDPDGEMPDSFNKRVAALISAQEGQSMMRHAKLGLPTIVAAGSLFPDRWLSPGETISCTIIFYVSRKEYALIDAKTLVPSVEVKSGIELQWAIDEKTNEVVPTMYRVDPSGKREPMNEKEADEQTGYQQAVYDSQFSLWE